jgi:class 3 adenylate cyclase/CHASE2 domain-containing sensor protein
MQGTVFVALSKARLQMRFLELRFTSSRLTSSMGINRFRSWSIIGHPFAPGLIATLLALGVWQLGAWRPFERFSYNFLFKVRETLPYANWDSRIAVIAIDEASLKRYGRFPWPRDRYTELLRVLESVQPAVVGFDILFSEPTSEDASLASAIADSGNVVLAIATDKQGYQLNLAPQFANISGQGHIYHQSDPDGITRRSHLYLGQYPAFGLTIVQMYDSVVSNTIHGANSPALARPLFLPKPNPNQKEHLEWINWIRNTEDVPTYSFVDVLDGKVEAATFKNKLVLVGTTATGLDPLQTPVNQVPPTVGVYFQAAIIDNLLNNRFLQKFPDGAIFLLLLGMGVVTNGLLLNRGPGARVAIAFGFNLVFAATAFALLYWGNNWIAIAAPIGTSLLTGGLMQLREQREKFLLMDLFGRYVAPETAKLLWKNKDDILQAGHLQAQELVATVLFMDIRGFTSISEKLGPQALLTWLNRYLDSMTNCIMDHGGWVDKYIGDAIMAVFGVPVPRTNHAEIEQDAVNAIAASLAMQEQLEILNQQFQAEGNPPIEMGIGIHTGVVVAGSLGGSRRLNYSVIGDTVNIAARLQAMNKEVTTENPYQILVTRITLSHIQEHYRAKHATTVQLRGREGNTMIFSILGKKSILNEKS